MKDTNCPVFGLRSRDRQTTNDTELAALLLLDRDRSILQDRDRSIHCANYKGMKATYEQAAADSKIV